MNARRQRRLPAPAGAEPGGAIAPRAALALNQRRHRYATSRTRTSSGIDAVGLGFPGLSIDHQARCGCAYIVMTSDAAGNENYRRSHQCAVSQATQSQRQQPSALSQRLSHPASALYELELTRPRGAPTFVAVPGPGIDGSARVLARRPTSVVGAFAGRRDKSRTFANRARRPDRTCGRRGCVNATPRATVRSDRPTSTLPTPPRRIGAAKIGKRAHLLERPARRPSGRRVAEQRPA